MQEVTVNKTQLLNVLKENRANHLDTFDEAIKVYRKAWHDLLEQRIKELENGQPINRAFALPEPENHTDDYTVAIGMLEMELGQEVKLSDFEYRQYVLDEWGWLHTWQASTMAYTQA